MKLVKSPCKIVGVRVGEIAADLITSKGLRVKYVLLRNPKDDLDGINAGQYTKEREFSDKTMEALEHFVSCLEDDVLPELFEVARKDLPDELKVKKTTTEEKDDEDRLDFPRIPTLGNDGKPTPQV